MIRFVFLYVSLLISSCTLTRVGGQYKVEGPLDMLEGSVADTVSGVQDATRDVQGAAKAPSNYEDAYPKASDDATIVYELESNKERTRFYIDGKDMGMGRRLKLKINKQEHTIVAQPEGCVYKEEFIRPPYNLHAPLRFTFLLGECNK